MIRKYIVIDDDPFNNILCNIEIESALGEADIKTFESPEKGLAFIQSEYNKSVGPTILFLDINMPTLSGWEFMEKYEKFNAVIKEQIRIYIVSSSVDPRDADKANANKYVKGFISKPLEEQMILTVAAVPWLSI
jgi:response regulator RpfG family c-di-GMP phosphodiesterase